jgi:cell division protein FtsI/penicillin-binding protein 2
MRNFCLTFAVVSFAAVVSADKPKYLVFTTLDEPQPVKDTYGYQTSGWNAAPLAGNIIMPTLIFCDFYPKGAV